jgi:hypothetical protein
VSYKNKIKMLACAFCAMCFASSGFAQSSDTSVSVEKENNWKRNYPKPHMGLLAGVAHPEGYNSSAEYGVDMGFQPYVPFGAGVELSSATSSLTNAADLTRTKLLVKGAYNFGGGVPVIKDSYVGVGVGPMLESYGGSTEVAVGFMPYVGFDVPLQKKAHEYMTAGLAARYLATTSGGPDAFSVNGALKYWF